MLASAWNIIGHLIGWYTYIIDSALYSYYGSIVQAGEIAQLIAINLFSSPIVNLARPRKREREGDTDGPYMVGRAA